MSVSLGFLISLGFLKILGPFSVLLTAFASFLSGLTSFLSGLASFFVGFLFLLLVVFGRSDDSLTKGTGLIDQKPLSKALNVKEMVALDVLDLLVVHEVSEADGAGLLGPAVRLIFFLGNGIDFCFSHALPDRFAPSCNPLYFHLDHIEVVDHVLKEEVGI